MGVHSRSPDLHVALDLCRAALGGQPLDGVVDQRALLEQARVGQTYFAGLTGCSTS